MEVGLWTSTAGSLRIMESLGTLLFATGVPRRSGSAWHMTENGFARSIVSIRSDLRMTVVFYGLETVWI